MAPPPSGCALQATGCPVSLRQTAASTEEPNKRLAKLKRRKRAT